MIRTGNFTSSSIHKLCGNGKGSNMPVSFDTYVKEKSREIVSGREIANESKALPLEWGNLCEPIAFELLSEQDINYKIIYGENFQKIRYTHLELPWSGEPDHFKNEDTVCDTKCPVTLTSWYDMIELDTPETLKKKHADYYWQLGSNAVLSNRPIVELNLFMPKFSRVESIIEAAIDQGSFIQYKDVNELPWNADDSIAPEIFTHRFEFPKNDLELMKERIHKAANQLEIEVEILKNKLKK